MVNEDFSTVLVHEGEVECGAARDSSRAEQTRAMASKPWRTSK
jgi:hypothetical protein